MKIIPAIDLRNGKCVRLFQGDFEKEEIFSDDPVQVAIQWENQGAERIHVVDLDGAATGDLTNISIIEMITKYVHIPIQVGGGVRSSEAARKLLDVGVSNLIVGTAVVENINVVDELLEMIGSEALIVGIDAKDGIVATRGWVNQSNVIAFDLINELASKGFRQFIYTDISKDGTMTEPNFEAISELVALPIKIIASGGVATIDQLHQLRTLGAYGAIVGKALYTGDIDLRKAISEMTN
ncbi:MAG: 1-(5-phosphoribosyl)-5-[(5-phosphoribosylamino)methylideneamino]imidazole-4-carboxamide isomerase [Chloroflexi bacterium]|nr:1-(5-phosphoribosyl)-5-[(5-phosphoribosylamino)methylideneamino]imidazole-4-carboxamide isomerase [Chloroflexota bacterium]